VVDQIEKQPMTALMIAAATAFVAGLLIGRR
jgi:ElaB/YqjD/DUF883 family membrane-anchored ribosome-binding protein